MKSRKKYNQLLIVLLLFIIPVFTSSDIDEDIKIDRITGALKKFNSECRQQKVYLHIDKKLYKAGEIIWFKAYLVDGANHLPDSISKNLYVELIGPDNTVIDMHRLLIKKGISFGDFEIKDTVPEGLYQVRAYTNWMKNFDVHYFFSENVQVINPNYSRYISPANARKNARITKRRVKNTSDFEFDFYPEGGMMVEGITGRLAFKAVNNLGKGIDIKGKIYNSVKNEVASFNSLHKGMGSLLFRPEKGEKYFSIVEYGEETQKIGLPQPLENGVLMRVDDFPDKAVVNLYSNRPVSADPNVNKVITIGQTRGIIHYKAIHDLSDDSVRFTIDKSDFPSGIMQLTVFSGRLVPLAERLIFVNHHDQVSYKLESLNVNEDKLTEIRIRAIDKSGNPVLSNFSLALINDGKTGRARYNNINNYMLLSSDLRGYIEDPGFYMKDSSHIAWQALDNLLLTQGWRRFEWSKIIANEFPEIKYPVENGITIDGKITREFFGVPLEGCDVTLSILTSYNDVFTTKSAKDGFFKFDGLSYFDTIDAKIEAFKSSGKKNLVIVLPELNTEKIVNKYGNAQLTTTLSTKEKKAYRRNMYAEEEKAMKEAKKKEEEKNRLLSYYGTPDNVIYGKDIVSGYSNVLQAIQGKVPGVNVNGNNVTIRGIKSIFGSNNPLYIIDGVPVSDASALSGIPVNDIERVEIYKGTSAAIFGSRGANGVIAIYTKRGEFMVKGVIEFQMLGYTTPRRFYQPKYIESGYSDNNNIPVTIFWNPVEKTDSNGEATIVVQLPENKIKYRMIIEGISNDGKTGYANLEF